MGEVLTEQLGGVQYSLPLGRGQRVDDATGASVKQRLPASLFRVHLRAEHRTRPSTAQLRAELDVVRDEDNSSRWHSTIGMVSPITYENMAPDRAAATVRT